MRERVLQYDIAVLVQRDARQHIDTYRRIERDARCGHRFEQLRVCNDPRASSSEFIGYPFEDFDIPTFAKQHVRCKQTTQRATDDNGAAFVRHIHHGCTSTIAAAWVA